MAPLLALLACTPSRSAIFAPVQRDIAERTGHRIHWAQDTREDRQVEAALDELLARELDADAAVQVALLNNRALQARYQTLGVARANLVQAGLLTNPVFRGALLVPTTRDSVKFDLSLEQEFVDVLFVPARRRLASASLDLTRLEVTAQVLDVAYDVRRLFFEHVSNNQLVDVLETFVEASELTFEVAQRLRAAGNIPELTRLQERALYEQAKLELATARAAQVQTRESLNAVMGLTGKRTAWRAPAALAGLPELPTDVATLEQRSLERSVPLQLARQQVDVAGRAAGLANASRFLPGLSVGVSAEQEDAFRVGPSAAVTLPVFDQGQARVAGRQAELRARMEEFTALAIRTQALARAVAGRLSILQERARYLREVLIPLRVRIVEESQLQYNAMTIGPFQLLISRRDELATRVEYARALRDYWVLRAARDQLLRGGLPPDLPGGMEVPSLMTAGDGGDHG